MSLVNHVPSAGVPVPVCVPPTVLSEDIQNVSVVSSSTFDAPPVSADVWDRFVLAANSDLYFTFDWCRVWWRHYGAGRELRLLAFRSGDRLVGLMPMFFEKCGFPGLTLRVAKLIGCDSTPTILQPAISPGWHERVASATIDHVLSKERCDAVWFGPLTGEGDTFSAFRAAGAQSEAGDLVRDKSPGVHSVFLLPESWDEYVASLDKKARYNFQRSSKLLAKGRVVVHEVVDDPAVLDECFARFETMHTLQWKETNQPGHFGDWPGAKEFTREAIRELGRAGRAVFMHVIVNGTAICRKHSFRIGRHLHWRLPARELGAEWDRLSIGNLALVMSIRTCIETGIRRIEGGPGHYESKVRHGATEFPIGSLLVVRRGLSARWRAWLMAVYADALHLTYYRVWRLRIAPRFGGLPAPLWRSWIRSRL